MLILPLGSYVSNRLITDQCITFPCRKSPVGVLWYWGHTEPRLLDRKRVTLRRNRMPVTDIR